MIIRLVSTQIAKFWDVIKYSLQQVERVGEDRSEYKFNEVFASLLNDKSQCFLKYSDDETITAVMITEILEDKINGERCLRLRSLYAFRPFVEEDWLAGYGVITQLAKSEKCSKIVLDTSNPKILYAAKKSGFVEVSTTMEVKIGG